MGLKLTNEDIKLIENELSMLEGFTKKQQKVMASALVAQLVADSRWVKVKPKDINQYTNGLHMSGDFPETRFTTRNSKGACIARKVKCVAGNYFVFLRSKKCLLPGWHVATMLALSAEGFLPDERLIQHMFDIGSFIISHKTESVEAA